MRMTTAALALLAPLALAGCAMNPVLEPYAYEQAAAAQALQTATVWGIADGQQVYFRKIDGKGLPSRGGGGYPMSLSLLPGAYSTEIFYINGDGRSAIGHMPMKVEAGPTYKTEYELSPDGKRVALYLQDLGTATACHYERYRPMGGAARLVCR